MSSPQFEIGTKPEVPPRQVPVFGCGGRVRVEALLNELTGAAYEGQAVTVCGWSKTVRKQGAKLVFITLTDGSTASTLQVVVTRACLDEESDKRLQEAGTAVSFRIVGSLAASPKEGQARELQVCDSALGHSVKIYGLTDQAKFPLAKKNHSKEFLREIQHLRPRSYLMGCVMRIRSALAGATHQFFQERGFQYIHTPIITAADCEGAGEMFQVTTTIPASDKIPEIVATKQSTVDYKKDFFGKKAYLTVSGQLNVEAFACALSDVYTFGPTFRAEVSHTSRHLAEFWMIEPEMAFADLEDNMRCAEAFLRYCVQYILERHPEDIAWLEKNVEEELQARLENIAQSPFARCSYTEAIEILLQQPKDRFTVEPTWGFDMGSEHERYLAEEYFKKPVIVYNYPKDIKAFYMKVNDDNKTVRAMDILVPKIGEVVGGSQREEDLDRLDKMIIEKGLELAPYWWYRELRQYGTVPHSGFGVGFERLLMMITGVENIRDVIPFPRHPGTADF